MTTKEHLQAELETLSEDDIATLLSVARRFSQRRITPDFDEAKVATLYAEFADEDRALAEAGMGDYAAGLVKEDAAS